MAHPAPPPQRGSAFEQLEQELGVLLRRARGVSGSLARAVHPEVDAAAYGLLARIDELGTLRVTDLAEFFSVGKPTVSRQIALLEQLGLISRVMNDDDARSRHLSLTAEGRVRLSRAREARQDFVRDKLADWPPEDVELFAGLLHRYNGSV